MSNINKYAVENSIRLSLFRHHGNVVAVANELGYDLNYVKSICKKIQTKMNRDVNYQIASSIMEQVLFDYNQRVLHLTNCLNSLSSKTEAFISPCCKMPVKLIRQQVISKNKKKKQTAKYKEAYICPKCGKECHGILSTESKIYNLLFQTVEQLREEDKNIVEAAVNLKFTAEQPTTTNLVRQNVVMFNNNSKNVNNEENETIKEINKLDGIERQSLVNKLHKALLEGEVVETK